MSRLNEAIDALVEVEGTIHESLNTYRHWRPDLELPALYNHLTRGRPAPVGAPACKVEDWTRITVCIVIDPTAVAGEGDYLELEAYFDLAMPALEAAVYVRNPLGLREARIPEWQVVLDKLGGADVLTLEIAVEVRLDRSIPTNP